MIPSDQGFGRYDRVRSAADDRLIVHLELNISQRGIEIALERRLFFAARDEIVAVANGEMNGSRLTVVHRHVGRMHEIVDRRAIFGKNTHADARR